VEGQAVTYWALNAFFLGATALLVLASIVARKKPRWSAVGITMALLLVMTAVFDNVMIGVGLVGYDSSLISGAFIGIAPLEDFAYAIAAVVLLPTLWSLLGRRRASIDGSATNRAHPGDTVGTDA
jgi:lycopene cyclase domain-containing protein